ncbi:hypothetical protein CW304_07010 [Bacillus sp. UFRGS-B20]|nr:hypothetical protein CW304_07010 [Bacillus sp. UFRGS-B20]
MMEKRWYPVEISTRSCCRSFYLDLANTVIKVEDVFILMYGMRAQEQQYHLHNHILVVPFFNAFQRFACQFCICAETISSRA